MGNEAVARGALEAGVNGVFSYPGTPSTEISEIFNYVSIFQENPDDKEQYPELTANPVYFEFSVNEKVAMEKAIAYSLGNKKAMCVMKNVGMNVASDALMSITYQTIIAPLVIVICDDPGCHSSSNEQDSRYWGNMASVPVFNPATPEDAYKMTRQAFRLSEELRLPVIVRTTTRVSHARGMLSYNEISSNQRVACFKRMPEHINIPARTAVAHNKLLDKLHSDTLFPYFRTFNKVHFEADKKHLAVISSGISVSYLQEVIKRNNLTDQLDLLDLGLIFPFPQKEVLDFLQKGFNKVLIVEELDPIIESAVRNIAQKHNIQCEILGKDFAGLTCTGEFTMELIDNVVSEFLDVETIRNEALESSDQYTEELPPRPPALCSGCPHRATYYALKLLVSRDDSNTVLCGDIGCTGLGALPPLKMIDTINHMGMSISMAQGLSEAMRESGGKLVAMVGDGTFFHSGIASILNAVYTKSNILVIIFDNRTIGMTGHQDHPGATHLDKYNEIEISPLLKGMGIEYVESLMPFDTKDTFNKLKEALDFDGVSVLVSKAPCVFLPDYINFTKQDSKIVIDHDRCNTCYNNADTHAFCSREGSSSSNLARAAAKIKGEIRIDATKQACPANICNHGFMSSIQDQDYNTALNMVRDKLLFSRTCGDICHRPCELFSGQSADKTAPIKALKKFVSGIDENFKNFSQILERIATAPKKGRHIAIVGAGPAGLSAAYDLIRDGYEVTVFEKNPAAGGLIKYVIPDFRMDKNGFDYEVDQLEKMGVKFKFNTSLGTDIDLSTLSDQFDGIVIAVGLGRSNKLDIVSTISEDKCYDAISFLEDFNNKLLNIKDSSGILVIGGGNSAMDVSRSAKRLHPDNRVSIVCIEGEGDMPALKEEIKHAKEDGVEFIPNAYVESCSENGEISIKLHAFDNKSFLRDIKCDVVVVAIGQIGDKDIFSALGEDKLGVDNRIKADNKTGFTDFRNVFVAGDICEGDHMSLIGAIASGKRAVVGLKKLLEDYPYPYEGIDALLNLNVVSEEGKPSVDIAPDLNIKEWTDQFNLFQACEKCNHCIDNLGCPAMIKVEGKVLIDYPKCTRCGLCIDVCPNDAIQWKKETEMGSSV